MSPTPAAPRVYLDHAATAPVRPEVAEQVAADLPAKTEQVLSVELGAKHRKAYDQRLARERQRILGLLEEDTAQSRFIALKALTTLRQMALDPARVEVPRGGAGSRRASGGGRRRRPTASCGFPRHATKMYGASLRRMPSSSFPDGSRASAGLSWKAKPNSPTTKYAPTKFVKRASNTW